MTKQKYPHTRKDPRFPIKIRINHDNANIFTDHHIMNISKGGVFINIPNPSPIGTVIEFEFTLPEISGFAQHTMQVQGEVVWSLSYQQVINRQLHPGMGVRFVDINPNDFEKLDQYLKRLNSTR